MKQYLRIPCLSGVVFALALVACSSSPESTTDRVNSAESEIAEPALNWSYEGSNGPAHWGQFASLCTTGAEQSPVALTSDATSNFDAILELNYHLTSARLHNSNDKPKTAFVGEEQSAIAVNGHSYRLLQAHFHQPSEHTLDGRQFPMELHLVHADQDDNLAVIGIFFEDGEAHASIDDLIDSLKSKNHTTLVPDRLLPAAEERKFHTYRGSLTTPPCTEDVRWMVMDTPLQVSAEQLSELNLAKTATNRSIQPLNKRELTIVE